MDEQYLASCRARLAAIYEDLSHNVTLIYNRNALHVSFDLVAHSVLGFTFKGERLSRGWVECLVVGDTRVGKSKVAKALVSHYGLGRVADCERVSLAGLVGGMQQINKSWNINWGLIPLYDRQLLVLDEAQGLTVDQIGEMSGLRSNGVAELIKIQQERTPARCRFFWIANRRKAMDNRIDDLSYGVRAIAEVMGRMEDIARLDFGLVVSETDVPESVMNAKERKHVEHKYTSDLCHNLVLWAWSRRPEDIVFVDDCEDFILDAATRMSQSYSSEVPIVERSEQRIRLARLSCATAARLFSTDSTATKLLVRKEHVVLVEEFLHSIYRSKAMRYDRFSEARRQVNTFTPEALASCVDRLKRFNPDSLPALCAYLNENEEIDRLGLSEATGWELDVSRQFVQLFTTKVRALRPTQGRKNTKTPLLVTALKQLDRGAS